LVTGCSGYLATNLMEALKPVDCQIFGVSRSDVQPVGFENAAARGEFSKGDLGDAGFWERSLKGIDIVFHFAAQTSVYKANQDPVADNKANVAPMLAMLDVCRRKKWCPTIVFAGAATQVGVPERWPVNESVPDKPVTVYDVHKIFAENYLKYYSVDGTVKGVTLRLANVYGPGPRSSSADRGILNMMVRRALEGEPLTVYGEGQYIRDYVFVDDVVSAFLHAAASIERTSGQHYFIGGGQGRTISEAIRAVGAAVEKKTGQKVKVETVPVPDSLSPIEFRNFIADTSRFRDATGWSAKMSFAEGINQTINHWVKEKV